MEISIREWLALAAFASATVFALFGLVGLFRFSDPFSRMQAGGLAGTTAIFSTFIGALLLSPSWEMGARIVIIMLFFLISAPTGSYIVARFVWQSGFEIGKTPKKMLRGPKE
jgi:multicomponent Na+:H+ antiporter subunit G